MTSSLIGSKRRWCRTSQQGVSHPLLTSRRISELQTSPSSAGQFPCNRYTQHVTSSTNIDINLARKEMVILGSMDAGPLQLYALSHP
ncbi:hypothetical protein C1H46_009832 [Malus baccata]|uniref:Uncharacterized protein n=1 Tax=Malus baccata TaxID=106549 RepID=A0A540N0E4_MALBA|nr:hypothetical protein C1H46_009832 [Malus baccata]